MGGCGCTGVCKPRAGNEAARGEISESLEFSSVLKMLSDRLRPLVSGSM